MSTKTPERLTDRLLLTSRLNLAKQIEALCYAHDISGADAITTLFLVALSIAHSASNQDLVVALETLGVGFDAFLAGVEKLGRDRLVH